VAIVFFTSFFTNAGGALDSIRTYLPWLNRAGGASPHIHPWYFYVERLLWFHQGRGPVWSEAPIVILALVGGIAALRGKGLGEAHVNLVRVLFFYAALLTGIYSVIAYKTPWCLLGFLHGMILLAGVGAAVVLRWPAQGWLRWPVRLCLVVAAGHLAWLAWQTSFIWPADRRNPYVYAQTSPDILELVEKVQAIARVHPAGDQMVIKVMAPGGDYWPLPWYLRQFQQIGWWDVLPQDPIAPVMIVGKSLDGGWMKSSGATCNTAGFFSLRPDTFVELYVDPGLWQRYLLAKPKQE
jgi:predicted membrane-bound mannosyltransferase